MEKREQEFVAIDIEGKTTAIVQRLGIYEYLVEFENNEQKRDPVLFG